MRKIIAIAAMSFGGCSQHMQFAERAAFELRCPEDRLEFTALKRSTWGVRGCGRQATYQRINKAWLKVDEKDDKPFEFEVPASQ